MSTNTTELSGIAKALKDLKWELLKVAKSAKNPVVLISAEALPKIAKAIDPSGRINSMLEQNGDFLHFVGVSVVTKESGESGVHAALEVRRRREERLA